MQLHAVFYPPQFYFSPYHKVLLLSIKKTSTYHKMRHKIQCANSINIKGIVITENKWVTNAILAASVVSFS